MACSSARVVAERYAEAWRRGDLATLVDCYADGFVLHYFGRSAYAGDHVGKDAALAALAAVSAAAARELVAVEEVLAGDGTAALVVRERLTRDGESHELRRVLRYRVEGERFVECWLHDEDQRLVDSLWSPPTP
jgi:ketosteroid isomerase-like protein